MIMNIMQFMEAAQLRNEVCVNNIIIRPLSHRQNKTVTAGIPKYRKAFVAQLLIIKQKLKLLLFRCQNSLNEKKCYV